MGHPRRKIEWWACITSNVSMPGAQEHQGPGRARVTLRLAALIHHTITMSSRCTTSRSYSGPSLLASHLVERPIRLGISIAS
jgi:hypothetical protein